MMSEYLEITEGKEAIVERMLRESVTNESGDTPPAPITPLTITPTAGYCLKTRTKAGEKVFVNICTSDKVPLAKDISDEDLEKLLADPENSPPFRIPMSIGEPRKEEDKAGGDCTAYDVIVHPDFLERAKPRFLLQQFFLTLVLEGIANKYSLDLSMKWIVLKNRKAMGQLQDQFVRPAARPGIMELDHGRYAEPSRPQEVPLAAKPMEEKRSLGKCPEYKIVQEPPTGHPEFLVAEVKLPLIKSFHSITLDLGGDRILLATRNCLYHLDIYLPFDIVQEESGAQFSRQTRILTITMPVEPLS